MRLVALFISLFALVACKNQVKDHAIPSAVNYGAHVSFVPSGWSPEQIDLRCTVREGCPQQVALFLNIFPEVNGRIPITKCSAFLSAPNQITSNGHCDQSKSGARSYVIFQHGVSRRISRVVFKRLVPGSSPDKESGRPDVGIYELADPIHDFPPLIYASVGEADYTRLVGYVVNPGDSPIKFSIDKVECHIRRHEAIFPFSIQENPDVISAFGCSTRRGNSGAPMFAPGRGQVQAMLQGYGDPEKIGEEVRRKSGRELQIFERHHRVTATNLRCLSNTPVSCASTDVQQIQTRFTNLQVRAGAELQMREPPSGHTRGVRYKAIPFQFKDVAGNSDLTFEIFYQPQCFEGDQIPGRISVPLEHVNFGFNEWAEITLKSLGVRPAQFELGRWRGAAVEVRTQWPAAFGELSDAQNHPRRTWGNLFSIDLPRCAR